MIVKLCTYLTLVLLTLQITEHHINRVVNCQNINNLPENTADNQSLDQQISHFFNGQVVEFELNNKNIEKIQYSWLSISSGHRITNFIWRPPKLTDLYPVNLLQIIFQ
jgi:hypothetical protein